MSDYLFPEFNDDFVLSKLRERWRYEAMARAPHYTPNYWSFKGVFGIVYRYDNRSCKYCSFLSVCRFGVTYD